MKIMTFNIRADNILDLGNRWKYRSKIACDLIRKYDCDIIGLQEVANQMEVDLKENLKEYHHIGVSRTENFFMERNTILVKKKYKILEHRTFWLSKFPNKKGSTMWHSLFPRICTMIIYQSRECGKVCIYNTHLDCLSPVARWYGLKVILNDMSERKKKEMMPCILMGDFNAQPNGKLMKQFKREAYKLDGLRAVQDLCPELYKKATMGGFRDRERGAHIDYIFVSKEFDIVAVEIIKYNHNGKYPSDHYPVMAQLKLK